MQRPAGPQGLGGKWGSGSVIVAEVLAPADCALNVGSNLSAEKNFRVVGLQHSLNLRKSQSGPLIPSLLPALGTNGIVQGPPCGGY